MKQLLRMIESAKRNKVTLSDTIEDYSPAGPVNEINSTFFELIERCQPFVLFPKNKTPVEIADDDYSFDPNDPILNAPFRVYSIEMFGDHVSISQPRKGDLVQVFCDCLLACETKPMRFITYAFFHYNDPRTNQIVERVMLTAAFNDILKELTNRIATEDVGFQQINQKVKLGTGSNKRFHKIRKVVYVKPKKAVLGEKEEAQSKLVNWTQRWFVRGHWRKTDTLGKDREGNYSVEGFTWVTEHVKGPEDAPLVKKTRVVQEPKNAV